LRLGRFGIGGWIETMSLMDHFASGLHALSASESRRSRRCIARENGGLDIACDMASWTINRAEAYGPLINRPILNESS